MSKQSAIPRLALEQLSSALQDMLAAKVKRLGYLGEFQQAAGNEPRSLEAFLDFTDALKEALPDRLTEVVALTVAARAGNRYEQHQHERLSEKLGFGRDWVAAVLMLAPDTAPGLAPEERGVQRLALAALRELGHGAGPELDEVVGLLGPRQAVAVLLLVGRYVTQSIFVNALGLKPPVASIFAP